MVSADNQCTKVNILFDEGAQRSFISQALASSLRLCPKRTENIYISSFGAESAAKKQLGTVIVIVEALNSSIRVNLIVPNI